MTKTLIRNSVLALVALAIPSLIGVGDALAGDEPRVSTPAAACAAEMQILAAPSKEEADNAKHLAEDERVLAGEQAEFVKLTDEYRTLGCMNKGVWSEQCSRTDSRMKDTIRSIARSQDNVVGARRLNTYYASKRIKELEKKLAEMKTMCDQAKAGMPADPVEQQPPTTATSTDNTQKPAVQDNSAAAEQDTTEEPTEQDTTEEPSDEDNAAADFPEPTDEATGENNSGVSEPTDQDNTAATEPDDTQEATGEDDSGASEATDNNNSAAAETDPDAELVATCAANPNCHME